MSTGEKSQVSDFEDFSSLKPKACRERLNLKHWSFSETWSHPPTARRATVHPSRTATVSLRADHFADLGDKVAQMEGLDQIAADVVQKLLGFLRIFVETGHEQNRHVGVDLL